MRSLLLAATLAFVGVNVVTMNDDQVLRGYTVIVEDGVVAELGPMSQVRIPAGAHVVYGDGRWLMPGLIDMHVHVNGRDLRTYLANGVTTVRDMAGTDWVFEAVRAVESGSVPGPRVIVGSRLFDGPPPAQPIWSVPFPSVAAAQKAVDEELARGCRFVKVYERLTPAMYDAIVAAARARNVRVAGHVTRQITIEHALASQQSIEHLSGYDSRRAAELAARTRAAGVWNCPTLAIIRSSRAAVLPPELVEDEMRSRYAMVKALHDAGAPILAGTDSGGGLFDVAGAISAELLELEKAGLTPREALAAATCDAAAFLEMPEIGTVRKGARADLLLLEANPLDSLTALRRIAGVAVNGVWQVPSAPRRRAAAHP